MSDLTDKQKHVITTAADILAAYNGNGDAKLADSLRGILQSLEARRTQPEATAPAQDLSAAILAITLDEQKQATHDYGAGSYAEGFDDALAAAAALASSAKALSAGDRVDAKNNQEGCCGHDSDCAVHNAPALPVGPCDCTLSRTAPIDAIKRGAGCMSSDEYHEQVRDGAKND